VASSTLRVTVKFDGVREMQRAFRQVDREAGRVLRTETLELSELMAAWISGAARSSDRQSAAVAPTVRARRDRVPNVVAGGNRNVTGQSRRSEGQGPTKAFMLLFGSNFGATRLRQYRSHRGAGSADYWFFSTIDQHRADVNRAWNAVVDEVLESWADD
jgi:hypothetical protein